ncbi:peptidase inhibitor family I36 protein [Devosia chinhatensis]|uniref:SH3b domain-containing protein n=1 Tax=Devosia chinhatensis TaxID=429727 RepID=A0A0F5FPP8_9HYPH|nr:peptidase inhibitor family I36 protein [Devosia chinhatensis]KKB10147.1 hypothetical protein VE26_10300 [Devosia chinhatensis]
MSRLLAAFLCFVFALFAATPSFALSPSGSHAWSRTELGLRAGPGGHYDSVGIIAAHVDIKVLRCVQFWCLVDGPGGHGWADRNAVDFRKNPYSALSAAGMMRPDLQGGRLCFYEGTHYTGRSFCAGTGQVFPDLALWGWDNAIRSIAVEVDTSAAVCRERDFRSYCERVYQSQPVLTEFLFRNVSSIRVY